MDPAVVRVLAFRIVEQLEVFEHVAPGSIARRICPPPDPLVLLGSVVAAFAGTIADPVQVRLGMHRRRLMRLLDTLDAEIDGSSQKPFVAREHFLVRAFDLWNAAVCVLRAFRS